MRARFGRLSPWLAVVAVALLAALLRPTTGQALARGTTVLRAIDHYRSTTWYWQRLMGHRRTPTAYAERRIPDPAFREWVLGLWRARAARARRNGEHPPLLSAWLCIHRHEAGWRDPGAPYYGGLQMDLTFQRHYGAHLLRRKGTANHWTVWEQIWVADRAYRSGRGFAPWPNTARACGVQIGRAHV